MNRTLSLFRTYLSKATKLGIIFPSYIQEVLTGMLLGDACLTKPGPTARPKGTTKFL